MSDPACKKSKDRNGAFLDRPKNVMSGTRRDVENHPITSVTLISFGPMHVHI